MESRSIWTDLIGGVGLEIASVFNQAMEEYRPGIFKLLNKVGAEADAQRTVTGKTGIGELEKFDDGSDVPGGRRYKTYNTTVAYNNYGKYVDVTKNLIEDRDYANELNEFKDLSIGANYSQDKSGVQILNGGFATTVTVNGYDMTWYGDGLALFSTIHPTTVPGGSTQSNASSTGIPFGADNLETAYIALEEQQTDDGLPMSFMGMPTVVLPTPLRKEGLEITESQLDPETANNAINVYTGGMSVNMATTVFLNATNSGSDTAWFLVSPGRHFLNHEVRQEPRLEQDTNIKNKVVTFTVDARWADSATEWKRTWASKGDLAAYAT